MASKWVGEARLRSFCSVYSFSAIERVNIIIIIVFVELSLLVLLVKI